MADQKATSNELAFLSQKRVLLSNPGVKLNQLYYSFLTSQVDLVENTWNLGRFTQSLTAPNYSSNSQNIIPAQSFIAETYLYVRLADLGANNIALCRGWLWALIDELSYLFGSANVSQLSIDGKTNFMTMFEQAETKEKRDLMMTQGGQSRIFTGVFPFDVAGPNEAMIQLALPWSSASGLFNKRPFDTSLLRNPITISIKFNPARAILGGVGLAGNIPIIEEARLILRQGNLSNKDQSLRMRMLRDPSLLYSYPFIHHETHRVSALPIGTSHTMNLLGFINADLLSISIGFIRDAFVEPVGSDMPQPFQFENIKNPVLKFNGLTMYDAPSDFWKLVSVHSEIGQDSFGNNEIGGDGSGPSPFTQTAVEGFILTMDFSRIRALSYEGFYQNVWRIGTNTLTLSFDTDLTLILVPFISYYYNGLAEIQNGETRIFFD